MQNRRRPIDRIHWIDIARGICIMAIVLYHTESYYIDYRHVFQYEWLTNVLKTFYFLSGYLLYQEGQTYDNKYLAYKTQRIVKGLVIPYFLFTTLMAVPKSYVHGYDIADTIIDIVMGNASWFITALIVAELFFIIILRFCRRKTVALAVMSIAGILLARLLSQVTYLNPWRYIEALAVFVFLFLGYLYHQYERFFHRWNRLYTMVGAAVFIIIMKVITESYHIELTIHPLRITSISIYMIDAIIGIALIVSISQLMVSNRLIEYTGKLSILIYFLNGGVSVFTSTIMNRIGFIYDELYYRVVLVFILNYLILLLLSYIIYRYLPFMIGKQRRG